MDMFGGLLERPLVAADALDRYPLLVSAFDKELDDCKLLYDRYIQRTEELGEIQYNSSIFYNWDQTDKFVKNQSWDC